MFVKLKEGKGSLDFAFAYSLKYGDKERKKKFMVILPDGLREANSYLEAQEILPSYEKGKRRLCVLLLNLMPEKQVTEADIVRMLQDCEWDIELLPVRIAGQQYKTTPQAYVEKYYAEFDQIRSGRYDGMIVTGAPIEHLPFETVRYWRELCEIMTWAEMHVRSTLYICWGAQAALYFQWKVTKCDLKEKKFGVFPYRIEENHPLFTHLGSFFCMPTSRHTEVRQEDFPDNEHLHIVARSVEAGIGVVIGHNGREVYITGHLEYASHRLDDEYRRDLIKGKSIKEPEFYYNDEGYPLFQWEHDALQIYHNWIQAYVASSE